MNLREFLISPVTYLPPAQALDGLDAAAGEKRLSGAPHSVAEIVAHMAFWQEWFYARLTGNAMPIVSSAAAGWPAVAPNSWPAIRSQFLERLEQLASLSNDDITRRVEPPIEFPPLATYSVGEALVHVANHNGHHLGQVILLRQLTGAWPPPAGSWTW